MPLVILKMDTYVHTCLHGGDFNASGACWVAGLYLLKIETQFHILTLFAKI